MASKLGIYNAALVEVGESTLSTLTDDVEARYVIDAKYDDVLAECLESGLWNFAMRLVKIDANTSVSAGFGYNYVFDKPSDWVRTAGLSASEYITPPLLDYEDFTTYWLADVDPIYVRYVSNDASYGGDLSEWTALYSKFVAKSLARDICERLSQNNSKWEQLEREAKRAKRDALNKDAMNEPTKFPPQGSWTSARGGTRRIHRTGSSLTG